MFGLTMTDTNLLKIKFVAVFQDALALVRLDELYLESFDVKDGELWSTCRLLNILQLLLCICSDYECQKL